MIKNLFVLILFFAFTSINAQINLNSGLVAYFPFSGNANDVSGNNINGVVTGASLTNDRFNTNGNAYYFDGNSYIGLPYSNLYNFSPQGEFSISVWVLPDQGYNWPAQAVVVKSPPNADFLASSWNYGTYILNYHAMAGFAYNNFLNGTTSFTSTQCWYNIIQTYKNGIWNLYVNGKLEASDVSQTKFILQDGSASKIYFGKKGESFGDFYKGKMDDIRIYNRVLNTDEIAAINNENNIQCNLTSQIINQYTPVLALDPCKSILTVEDANNFNAGDTVLMIQMKGAVIDSSNTAAFGNITNYKSAGNYEFNYIKSKTGNNIELLNQISRTYEIPAGKVQLVRVPYYGDITFNAVLTCAPWDGSKGGVLVFNSSGTVTLNEDVDVSRKGFRKGASPNTNNLNWTCNSTDYFYAAGSLEGAAKGEGIADLSNSKIYGRGPLANGGGGGNQSNAGGGGGANIGAGGLGGNQLAYCNGTIENGIGGKAVNITAQNKIILGGGGGSGDANNPPPNQFSSNGGGGGGIIIISANQINVSSTRNILSNGEAGLDCNTGNCYEGMGGGGAGGSVLLNIKNYNISGNLLIAAKGGKGADASHTFTDSQYKHGPGGGGGGGLIWFSNLSIPLNIVTNINGGFPGVNINFNSDTWGAMAGQPGTILTNLNLPIDNVLFKPNIDSVRIKDSIFNCSSFDFKGLAYINTNPINLWQWNFGNGASATSQNTSYSYSTDGTFPVKLIITDINGCKDSTAKNVIVQRLIVDAGKDTSLCKNSVYQLNTSALNAISFNWTPSQYLNNSNIQNPVATVVNTQKFYFTATNSIGCTATDSVTLNVYPDPVFTISPDQSICKNETVQLTASGGNTYQWQNESSLSALNISNPSASPATTTTYAVKVTDQCNISDSLFTTITVKDLPVIRLSKSNDIDCSNDKSVLSATGASEYIWSPVTGLDNPSSSNPVASPTTTTEYTVKGTDVNGCSADGKTTVEVTANNKSGYNIPNAFTPNGDGKNDCIRVKYWGPTLEFEFNIYNRWGEKVFTSKNTNSCWDGTYKGVQQPLGVYMYYIKAKTICGDVFKKGTITLIR